MTINVPVTFKAASAGVNSLYVTAVNNANLDSGGQTIGTWTVQ